MKEKLEQILRNVADGYKWEIVKYEDPEGGIFNIIVVENPHLELPEIGNNVITVVAVI